MLEEVGLFAELAVHGRAYDYNENGVLDVAVIFFQTLSASVPPSRRTF